VGLTLWRPRAKTMADKVPGQVSPNPAEGQRHGAVALSLSPTGQAPTVVAKGYGVVAEAILERARESGLYVHASSDLVKLLMHVDLDARIPANLYVAVAEILTWMHQIETEKHVL
jgi:flagellar biosynthesis protein